MTFICLNIELRTQPLIILVVIAGTDKERLGCSKIPGCINYQARLGADHLTFEGGGWKISRKNFLQPKEKEKNQSIQSRKKNIMQKRALKKIPTCKSTDAPHFSIVSTGLQDFAFLSRHICLKEHRVNSGQHHRDSTAFRASNIW
jgi:hypothetical protein